MNDKTNRAGDEPEALTGRAGTPRDGKPVCGARRRSTGTACQRPAGWGTTHAGWGSCKLHGGSMPNQTAHAVRLAAGAAAVTYGAPREVDPVTALFEEVYRTAGHVHWLTNVVANVTDNELVWGVTEEVDRGSGEFPGIDVIKQAKPSVWIELYYRERRHLLEVSKTVVSLSLEQRRDTQKERLAAQLAILIEGIQDDAELGLSGAQKARLLALVVERVRAFVGPQIPAPRRLELDRRPG